MNLSRHVRGGRETGEYLKDVTRRGNSGHEPLTWNKLGTVRGAVSRQSEHGVSGGRKWLQPDNARPLDC